MWCLESHGGRHGPKFGAANLVNFFGYVGIISWACLSYPYLTDHKIEELITKLRAHEQDSVTFLGTEAVLQARFHFYHTTLFFFITEHLVLRTEQTTKHNTELELELAHLRPLEREYDVFLLWYLLLFDC